MIRLLTFLYQDRDALEGMNPFPTSSDQSKLRIRMAVLSLLFHGLIGTAAPMLPKLAMCRLARVEILVWRGCTGPHETLVD